MVVSDLSRHPHAALMSIVMERILEASHLRDNSALGLEDSKRPHGEPPDHSIIETLGQEAGRG